MSAVFCRDGSDCPSQFQTRYETDQYYQEHWEDVSPHHMLEVRTWEHIWSTAGKCVDRTSPTLDNGYDALLVGVNSLYGVAWRCSSKKTVETLAKYLSAKQNGEILAYWEFHLRQAHHTAAYLDVISTAKKHLSDENYAQLSSSEELKNLFRELPVVSANTPLEERPDRPQQEASQKEESHEFQRVRREPFLLATKKEGVRWHLLTSSYTHKKDRRWKERPVTLFLDAQEMPASEIHPHENVLTVCFLENKRVNLCLYELPEARHTRYAASFDFVFEKDFPGHLHCSSSAAVKTSAWAFKSTVGICHWSEAGETYVHHLPAECKITCLRFPLKGQDHLLLIGTDKGCVYQINAHTGDITASYRTTAPLPVWDVVRSGLKVVLLGAEEVNIFDHPLLEGKISTLRVAQGVSIYAYGMVVAFSNGEGILYTSSLDKPNNRPKIPRNENDKKGALALVHNSYRGLCISADGALRSIMYADGTIRVMRPIPREHEEMEAKRFGANGRKKNQRKKKR